MARAPLIQTFDADVSGYLAGLRQMDSATDQLRQDLQALGQGASVGGFADTIESGLREAAAATETLEGKLKGLSNLQADVDVNFERLSKATVAIEEIDDELRALDQRKVEIETDVDAEDSRVELDYIAKRKEELTADRLRIIAELEGEEGVLKTLDKIEANSEAIESDPIDIVVRSQGMEAVQSQFAEFTDTTLNQLPLGLGHVAGKIGGLTGKLAGAGAVAATVTANVYKLSFSYAQLASSLDQTQKRLDIIIGGGMAGQIYEDLTEYSAKSLTSFEDLTTGVLRLASSGEVLDKNLIPYMKTLDDTAAATGSNAGEVAIVLSQMYNKGKIYYEELLQLAERNIPAVAILRQEMGLTAEELDEMARKGELTGDAIDALIAGFEARYGGSMAEMMDTLNGRMENIRVNLDLTKASLGELALEDYENLAVIFSKVALGMRKTAEAAADLEGSFGFLGSDIKVNLLDIIPAWFLVGNAVDFVADKIRETEDTEIDIALPDHLTDDLSGAAREAAKASGELESLSHTADTTLNAFEAWSLELQGVEGAMESFNDRIQDVKDNFSLLNESAINLEGATSEVEKIFDELGRGGSDMREGIQEAVEASGEFAKKLDITTEGGRAMRDMILESVQALDNQASAALANGEAVEDVTAKYDTQKQALIDQLVQLGFNEQAVIDYIEEIEKTPKEKKTQFKALLAEAALQQIIDKYGAAAVDRYSEFFAELDPSSYAEVLGALDYLTQTRGMTIEVAYRYLTLPNAHPTEGYQDTNMPRSGSLAIPDASTNILRVNIAGREVDAEIQRLTEQDRRSRALTSVMAGML